MGHMPRTALLVLASLAVTACAGSDDVASATPDEPNPVSSVVVTTEPTTTAAPPDGTAPPHDPVGTTSTFEAADFAVAPGTEQLTITGAEPGRTLTVFDDEGTGVAADSVDQIGSVVKPKRKTPLCPIT